MAVLTVEYEVGVQRQPALVRLYNQVFSNADFLPQRAGVGQPIVKPKGIDDVPVMALTLWTDDPQRGARDLAEVAHSLENELKRIPGTRDVATIGGPGHVIRVDMDTERMNAHGITAQDLRGALQLANASQPAGSLVAGNREVLVQTGTYLGPLLDLPDGRRLGGWTVPYDSELSCRAHELNRAVVAALGAEGAFVVHTECAVNGDGELVVVEVAGRAPGALVSELAGLHAGLNLEEANLALQADLPVPEPQPTGVQAAWVWIPVMPGERYRHTPETTSKHLVHIRRAAQRTHTGASGALGVSVLLWHTDPDVLAADVRTAATAAWCGA